MTGRYAPFNTMPIGTRRRAGSAGESRADTDAGMTHVNDSPVNDDANMAFGGEKASGVGRFGGQWAIDEFSAEHWVSVQHRPREYAI
ncbi:aldehyde dehydrogenase family protein [Mycobacterium scrofulaceum]|uniref:Aldehyde dehydrogenase domain-containing protein n=1 Tax=Mycobacterium scrofulaceum TaxID=1783 RepID=A0A1A2W6H6_MYCSC|nr:aldehyde dehydrogenase family protein [Mycobacterium scrofulaceum]OBI08491.1 hypothetical protein A5679_09490 [Mycobacterium scrofulaceum]